MPFEIIGIGLACYDHLVVVPGFEQATSGCYVERVLVQGGGITATASVAAARLGARAALYARLADDFFGRFIRDELVASGVAVPLPLVPAAKSPVSTVLVDAASGQRRFIYFPGEGLDAGGLAAPDEEIRGCRVLLLDGRWRGEALRAASIAAAAGVPIVADVGHTEAEDFEILRLADYPLLSREILGERGGSRPARQAFAERVLADGRARSLVLTLGEEGCEVYRRDGGVQRFPAFRVDVVDTTGAGDAFHGAFAFGIARGWRFERALELAQAAGALVCRSLGGRTTLPTLDEALAFIAHTERRF